MSTPASFIRGSQVAKNASASCIRRIYEKNIANENPTHKKQPCKSALFSYPEVGVVGVVGGRVPVDNDPWGGGAISIHGGHVLLEPGGLHGVVAVRGVGVEADDVHRANGNTVVRVVCKGGGRVGKLAGVAAEQM